MVKNIIETFNLTKKYKLKGKNQEIIALDNANIKVREGEIFGFLGPNGAGKTTMVQILTTLIQPTSGYALIEGFNILEKPRVIKNKVSLMLGVGMIYRRITGYDNLKFFCKIYNIKNYDEKIYNIAKEFNLDKWLKQYVEKYSMGMKVKLSLCRALLMEKPILFLDEPTLGVDVSTTLHIIDVLKELDNTIFLTSHNMHVVDRLCDRIAFIDNGKILKVGSQEELKRLMQYEVNIEIGIEKNQDQLLRELKTLNYIKEAKNSKNRMIITLNEKKYYKNLFSVLSKYEIQSIKEKEMTLDDLFINII